MIVLGQLNAGGIVKSQFGSSRITRNRQSDEMVSLADDLKAAAKDALKKCATLLGVGLHLYGGNVKQQDKSFAAGGNGSRNHQPANGNGVQNGNGNGKGNGNGNSGGRLTSKQYRYILRLNQEQGRSKSDLDQQCLGKYGDGVGFLLF